MSDTIDDIVIPPAAELIKWLDVATRGMGNLAKKRIADEIGAHHREAYESALDQGVTTIEAERRAMASLGDSSKASHGFRKAYLTVDEEGILRYWAMVGFPRWRILGWILYGSLFTGGVVAGWIAIAGFIESPTEYVVHSGHALTALVFLMCGTELLVVERLHAAGLLKVAALWRMFAWSGFMVFILHEPATNGLSTIPLDLYFIPLILLMGFCLYARQLFFDLVRLWRKLPWRMNGDEVRYFTKL